MRSQFFIQVVSILRKKIAFANRFPDRVDGFRPSVSDPSRDSLGRLTLHDIHGLDGEQRALWDQLNQHETVSVPHVLVRGSVGPSKEFVLWKGPLSGLQNALVQFTKSCRDFA